MNIVNIHGTVLTYIIPPSLTNTLILSCSPVGCICCDSTTSCCCINKVLASIALFAFDNLDSFVYFYY